jgi:hypothetical protein
MTAAFRSASYFGLLVFGDESEQPVFFVGDSSREKDSARLREKIPQAIKLERCAIEAHERLDKIAVDRIVIIDEAVPEIADPKVAFHESKSPWGIEVPVRD